VVAERFWPGEGFPRPDDEPLSLDPWPRLLDCAALAADAVECCVLASLSLRWPLADLEVFSLAGAVVVWLRWFEEVRGGGCIGGPAAPPIGPDVADIVTTGEVFVDGGSGRARGVVIVELLDSAGE
jgi:hypothetical protein